MSMKEEQLRLVMDQESKIYLWNYIKYLGTYNSSFRTLGYRS